MRSLSARVARVELFANQSATVHRSSLNDPSLRPELVSSFVVLPPSSNNSSLSDDFSQGHRATVQSALPRYPEDDALPPPWTSYSDNRTGWSSMGDFFSSAATTEPLGRRALDPRDPNGLVLDVLTRSWVTLARDFARYERRAYEKAMANLRAQEGVRLPFFYLSLSSSDRLSLNSTTLSPVYRIS